MADNDSPKTKLFVRYRNAKPTEEEMREIFSKHGTVVDISLYANFGFIEYDLESSAEAAVKAENGSKFKNVVLDVEITARTVRKRKIDEIEDTQDVAVPQVTEQATTVSETSEALPKVKINNNHEEAKKSQESCVSSENQGSKGNSSEGNDVIAVCSSYSKNKKRSEKKKEKRKLARMDEELLDKIVNKSLRQRSEATHKSVLQPRSSTEKDESAYQKAKDETRTDLRVGSQNEHLPYFSYSQYANTYPNSYVSGNYASNICTTVASAGYATSMHSLPGYYPPAWQGYSVPGYTDAAMNNKVQDFGNTYSSYYGGTDQCIVVPNTTDNLEKDSLYSSSNTKQNDRQLIAKDQLQADSWNSAKPDPRAVLSPPIASSYSSLSPASTSNRYSDHKLRSDRVNSAEEPRKIRSHSPDSAKTLATHLSSCLDRYDRVNSAEESRKLRSHSPNSAKPLATHLSSCLDRYDRVNSAEEPRKLRSHSPNSAKTSATHLSSCLDRDDTVKVKTRSRTEVDPHRQSRAEIELQSHHRTDLSSSSHDDVCEIIITDPQLRQYAIKIASKIHSSGLRVEICDLPSGTSILEEVEDAVARNCLFAVIITSVHMEHSSVTVDILHGEMEEHRNMLIEDAVRLISNSYQRYVSTRNSSSDENPAYRVKSDERSGSGTTELLPDNHTKGLIRRLADNQHLSCEELEQIKIYVEKRQEYERIYKRTLESSQGKGQGNSDKSDLEAIKKQQKELQSTIFNLLKGGGRNQSQRLSTSLASEYISGRPRSPELQAKQFDFTQYSSSSNPMSNFHGK